MTRLGRTLLTSLALGAIVLLGCSSDSETPGGAGGSAAGGGGGNKTGGSSGNPGSGGAVGDAGSTDAKIGGPVTGAADSHCGTTKQETVASACHVDAGAPVEVDAGDSDAGAVSDYGDTLFNSEGDDDDCKYHVKFTSDPIAENADVFFNVTVTRTVDGMPATGAAVEPQVFLGTTHLAPDTMPKPVETAPGVYRVGPVRFDMSGRWTVRFHLYEECDDGETSPHGHIAFFVDLP
jgi:hypothetical protein